MGDVPFVSIIVPTRNRCAILELCLKALCGLDYPTGLYEIFVVDDDSSDRTREVVDGISSQQVLPRVQYRRTTGRGSNAARNLGIEATKGDLVGFVDDDVQPPVQWLRTLVGAMVSQAVDLTWGPVILPRELHLPGRHRSEVVSYLSESMTPEIPLLCNMLVQRAVFQRGLFDPGWSAPVEEVEWLLRTNPSRAFAEGAWLWHRKSQEDCEFARLMKIAWIRGKVSGRFDRARRLGGFRPFGHAFVGMLRSVGHAVKSRCVGGVLVAAGRAGYATGYAFPGLRLGALK
jgi:glycosyltransferase involved in cell wall biosynthesis